MVSSNSTIHLHELQQLFAQIGIVGHENGLPLSVDASSACPAGHLSILCCSKHAVLSLNALVVVPVPQQHLMHAHANEQIKK